MPNDGWSGYRLRGQLYNRALAEFVARHADDRVQAAMSAVVAEFEPVVDAFTCEAARKTQRRVMVIAQGESRVGRSRRADWFATGTRLRAPRCRCAVR